MLIYAFRDASGHWHGDPDAPTYDTQPGVGTLTLPPTPVGQDAGHFDGQRLEVRYAACDLEPSPTSYRLDDGGTFPATWHVHELLSPAYQPPGTGQELPSVKLEIAGSHRRYSLCADLVTEDRAEITVIVCTPDGVIHGELTGEVDVCDLGEIARLLTAAPVAPATKAAPATVPAAANSTPATAPAAVAATRHGEAWTPEALDHLRQQHRAGKSPKELALALGRSEKSIRWKLYSLKLAPYPSDLVPGPRPPAAEAKPPKAYTMEEKRQLHPNAYKPWTPEDDQRLTERCAQGASLAELAEEFARNEGAIASRLCKINAQGPAIDSAWDLGG
ncbi:hypothetical protein AB0N92_17890 [Streptomyces sp. NPDC093248]|uniref:hypothetical protein n=1 Tax=Streptomyces sp. NPDC093248 TaxID=3155072 RepID=UPI00341B47C8